MDLNIVCQICGLLGFLTYVLGFASLQLGWIDGNGNTYALTSITGASLVLISLSTAFNLASALIQISWIIIGVVGILRRANFVRSARKVGPAGPQASTFASSR